MGPLLTSPALPYHRGTGHRGEHIRAVARCPNPDQGQARSRPRRHDVHAHLEEIPLVIADPGMDAAEVAIAVASNWKGHGIGWALLRHASDLAFIRGVKKLRSVESRANHDALEVERTLGFRARQMEGEPDLLLVEADLA